MDDRKCSSEQVKSMAQILPDVTKTLSSDDPEADRQREERCRQRAEREQQRELELQRQRRVSKWSKFIDARGKRYETCRLSNFDVRHPKQQQVVDAMRSYCELMKERVASGTGVMLIGPSGTGKDHLTTALVRAAIVSDLSVEWYSGPLLFSYLRSLIGDGGKKDEGALRKELVGCDVLVLSDLIPPCGKLTDYQAEFVYSVIDGRYGAMRPIWFTANVASRSELEAALGAAVVDRLVDGSIVFACDWPSYRKADDASRKKSEEQNGESP